MTSSLDATDPDSGVEASRYDLVGNVIRYESGDMDEDEVIAFFQVLIDDGIIDSLQGSYGRMAHALILGGLCHAA